VALVCLATGNPLPASCGGIDYTHLGTAPSECPDAATAFSQVGRLHSDHRWIAHQTTYVHRTVFGFYRVVVFVTRRSRSLR
jgi:hypothetical protein